MRITVSVLFDLVADELGHNICVSYCIQTYQSTFFFYKSNKYHWGLLLLPNLITKRFSTFLDGLDYWTHRYTSLMFNIFCFQNGSSEWSSCFSQLNCAAARTFYSDTVLISHNHFVVTDPQGRLTDNTVIQVFTKNRNHRADSFFLKTISKSFFYKPSHGWIVLCANEVWDFNNCTFKNLQVKAVFQKNHIFSVLWTFHLNS